MKIMLQTIINPDNDYIELDNWLRSRHAYRPLLVAGSSLSFLDISSHLRDLSDHGLDIIHFKEFRPNPSYESIVSGVNVFRTHQCDSIIAIGGGSAIDVAKCIRLFASLPGDGADGSWLKQHFRPDDIPFLAMPTTAGSGSEATGSAVIYYQGEKQSVSDPACLPETVLLDSSALRSLPDYQRRSTMMDALCHALESFWAVNSTEESREYSGQAIRQIMAHMDAYLENTDEGNAGMLMAAHTAGKAINITKTTAGHAMCYKITSLYGCAHGHAAAMCNRAIFPWMTENTDRCTDPRGKDYLETIFRQIAEAMECDSAEAAAAKLDHIYESLDFQTPVVAPEEYEVLKASVNPARIQNHPIGMSIDDIDLMYHHILR